MMRARINELLRRVYQNKATAAEVEEMISLLRNQDIASSLSETLKELWEEEAPNSLLGRAKIQEITKKILEAAPVAKEDPAAMDMLNIHKKEDTNASFPQKWHIQRYWMRYAAIIFFLAGSLVVSFWMLQTAENQPLIADNKLLKEGTHIDKEGVILTLSDGSHMLLDSLGEGVVVQQGNVEVVKQANGQIAYFSKGQSGSEVMMNNIKTPRGRNYQLTLPDGTKVWLNAASSITFPAIFTGTQRIVEVRGEAYFEVAVNKKLPFIVSTNGMEIEVLGTSFNVNAYEDDEIHKTTLVEGSIKIIKGNITQLLQPNEQALVSEKIVINKKADIQQAIAWKTGIFNFDGADLPTVMRQLARWYDIDVRYEGKGYDGKFKGKLSKSLPLEEIINILKDINLSFRIDGKTLIIQ